MENQVKEVSFIPEIVNGSKTIEEVQSHEEAIKQLMATVMKQNIHYGHIPGVHGKPTLLKPGAEKILTFLGIAVRPVCHDLSTEEEIRYRVLVKGYYQGNIFAGGGVGECSSNEEKYKWRKAICDLEFENTPEERRRTRWYKDRMNGGIPIEVKQIRVEAADQANTVLKIAKKRALIDMCLTVAGVSDIFTQDIEDFNVDTDNSVQSQESPTRVPSNPKNTRTESKPIPLSTKPAPTGRLHIVDSVKKISTKELQNGSQKWGILTAEHEWFSTFNPEHADIAEFAYSEDFRVQIEYSVKGQFKNISAIELLEKAS